MASTRTTRSGHSFSPYSLDWDPDPLHLPASFDFGLLLKQATVDATEALCDSEPLLDAENAERAERDLADHVAAVRPASAILPPHRPPSDASHPPAKKVKLSGRALRVQSAEPSVVSAPRSSSNAGAHRRRQVKRAATKETIGHPRRPQTLSRVMGSSSPITADLAAKDLPVSFGGYEGLKERIRGYQILMTPSKGLGAGFKIVHVDTTSERVVPILDVNNAVIAVLCPPLKDPSYRIDCETAFRTISDEGELALLRGLFTVAERNHRRGKFAAVNFGVFHGNGTGGAVNLKNGDHDPMIRRLRGNKAIQRLATFGSAAFQFWCPGVYDDYHRRLSKLYQDRTDLERIFPRSIFPAAAFNFGPRVCTYKHRDVLNCPYGWCGIHPLGNFDHTRGGHVLLWEAAPSPPAPSPTPIRPLGPMRRVSPSLSIALAAYYDTWTTGCERNRNFENRTLPASGLCWREKTRDGWRDWLFSAITTIS